MSSVREGRNEKTAGTYARLVELEQRASDLYLALARRFAENRDLSWFWFEMSMEEKQHALLLDFCGCEHLEAGDLPREGTVKKLSAILKSLEKRAARKDLSVDDAFLIAAELEGSEINEVYSSFVRPVQGTWYVMRKKIETLLSDHNTDDLVKAARRFGVSEAAMSKLAEIRGRRAGQSQT